MGGFFCKFTGAKTNAMPTIEAHLVDIFSEPAIRPVALSWDDGVITQITDLAPEDEQPSIYLVPGLVDAHVHIESSMLPPAEFGRWAAAAGTLSTVSDPHEIANVLGLDGVQFMIDEAKKSPIYHHLGAPSCVPATGFETAGATLGIEETRVMLEDMGLPYLSEMMNWPGVLHRDPEVVGQIALAHLLGKPVDGHAPGLRGAQAEAYAKAGITTDHECVSLAEAQEKLGYGMKILIRQGSAACNLPALHPLVAEAPGAVMLCTDDCHPDTLLHGHINTLVTELLELGHSLADILQAAHYTPKAHYGLPIGSLRLGQPADFLVLASLTNWQPLEVYHKGKLIAAAGKPIQPYTPSPTPNYFVAREVFPENLVLPAYNPADPYPIILAEDGQLITGTATEVLPRDADEHPGPDPETDTLLLAVANRYDANAPIATALIRGFGLKSGAVASSVAHDSHNVVAVGTSAAEVAAAINGVMQAMGGLALAHEGTVSVLPLPIAGLMSAQPGQEVAAQYQALEKHAQALGAKPKATFMLLSFMALLVIPSLKLSDRGLFDGTRFTFWQ
jgi:adenine deaminase